MRRFLLATVAATALGASAARAADTIVVQWNDVSLDAIRTTHPGPPIVARMLAIVDTCMYDAWTAYDARAAATRPNGIAKRPATERTDANKRKAISYAAYRALVDLFPTYTTSAIALMATLGLDPADTGTDTTTPTGIGNVACGAVLDFRRHDGSNQLGNLNTPVPGTPYSDYTGYVPANTPDTIDDPNLWQPLRVSDGHTPPGTVVQKYIAPFWGKVTPFNPKTTIPNPEGPDRYPGADYAEGVDRVLQYSANLTDTQKVIAEYWADGPKSELPPGHWALFAKFVSGRDNHTTDDDAKMFFAQSNAILDASIVSWGVKRVFNSVRPVTAVHFLKSGHQVRAWAGPGLGTRMIDGKDWEPYQANTVVTPPFPEYYSGHSIFSAAGAEILKRFTGSDRFGGSVTQAAGSSRVEPGITPAAAVTLSWRTFSDAANEAGISRRYGGIHFIPADLDARAEGRKIGKRDWALARAYFEGHPNRVDDDDGRDDD